LSNFLYERGFRDCRNALRGEIILLLLFKPQVLKYQSIVEGYPVAEIEQSREALLAEIESLRKKVRDLEDLNKR
jgi:hypothetical protein